MQTSALPFGAALALAQRALETGLTEILQTAGVANTEWYMLNALGLRGPQLPAQNLVALLATNGLGSSEAQALLDRMAGQGLIERDGPLVRLTTQGDAAYERLRETIASRTDDVLGAFGPARVETARSLLQDIAELHGDQITGEQGRPSRRTQA